MSYLAVHISYNYTLCGNPIFPGAVVGVIVWQLDLPLYEQSVSITTKLVSSNPVHGEVTRYNIIWLKFVSDFRRVGGFLRVLRFPPPIKLTATI